VTTETLPVTVRREKDMRVHYRDRPSNSPLLRRFHTFLLALGFRMPARVANERAAVHQANRIRRRRVASRKLPGRCSGEFGALREVSFGAPLEAS